ncbi:MAG: 16S rRNA (adenine(1518)-N(6)/adenine(1519)-N(6))-dimethyltransferase, partial [Bacilli bacterium]|nr:16S rRNA (adenine(1518)-N(6)/adenine(1519)-N(6))-dimethyltransferase [Bacilli bacterium]
MNKTEYFNDIKSYKLLANKSLGQNFLINPDYAEDIVNLLNINKDDSVLEIGAGLGSLSYFLAEQEAHSTLIDVDDRMIS